MKDICSAILRKFETRNSRFGQELFDKVSTATNNFTINLMFHELVEEIDSVYLDYMVSEYCKRNKNTFVLMVWPVTQDAEDVIQKHYGPISKILYKKEIQFQNKGFENCLKFITGKRNHPLGPELWFAKPYRHKNPLTLYFIEIGDVPVPRDQMFNYLVPIFNGNAKHISKIEEQGGLRNLYATTLAKRNCRSELSRNGHVAKVLKERPPFQYSHHVNDTHKETITLCNMFLNDNSVFALDHWECDYSRVSFEEKFPRYKEWTCKNPYGGTEDFCINNSSVLAQFGIRTSRDIDYLHSESFKIPQQNPEEEISSHNFVVKPLKLQHTIDDLVYNPRYHFWLHDIKFVTLNVLKHIKLKQVNNGKAKNDFNLINKFQEQIS